jgi:hypothetical protein
LEIGRKGIKGCNFILTHEATVTFHIGTEDGSKFAFDTLCGHGVSPLKSYYRKEWLGWDRVLCNPMFDRNLLLLLEKVNKNLTGFNLIICQITTLSNLNIKLKNACKNSLNSVIYSNISRTGGGR